MKSIWVVDTDSSNYSWRAYGATEKQAMDAFKKMWVAHCKPPEGDKGWWSVDPYYWGHKGDKYADISAVEVKLGSGYLDGSEYK